MMTMTEDKGCNDDEKNAQWMWDWDRGAHGACNEMNNWKSSEGYLKVLIRLRMIEWISFEEYQ